MTAQYRREAQNLFVQGGLDAMAAHAREGIGAHRVWLLLVSPSQVHEEIAQLSMPWSLIAPLEGLPVRCRDLRQQGKEARAQGWGLVVDGSLTGTVGCAAVRLGAHLTTVSLGGQWCLVAVARDVERSLPGVTERLDALPALALDEGLVAAIALDNTNYRWHVTSDVAQVVASYLACHPLVQELSYPGLKQDESFAVAARTLSSGFGPYVSFRLIGEDDWKCITCEEGDPKEQVMELERLLGTAHIPVAG